MRSNLFVKVRAHVVPAMTFIECSDEGFHSELSFAQLKDTAALDAFIQLHPELTVLNKKPVV